MARRGSCPACKPWLAAGKGGETIKALQQYTGAVIQIDQSTDPTKVTVAGDINSVELAAKMIKVGALVLCSAAAQLSQDRRNQALSPSGQPHPAL